MAQWFLDIPSDARTSAEILALFSRTVLGGTQVFEIFTDGSDKVLRMYRAASGSSPNSRVTINALGSDVGDCDIVVLERLLLSTVDRRSGPAARVSGSAAAHTLYVASQGGGSSSVISELNVDAAKGTYLSEVTGVNNDGSEYVWKRFQVSGTTLQVKQWAGARGDEPVEWQQTTIDSTIASGGVGFHNIGGSTTIGDYRVKTIAVGTGGDAPPTGPVDADTTAPTLTSPAASATGATTASGSVTTNEANGTLYYLASANATETDVTVKSGSSQAVTATGEQPVTITGLTAATPYYPHYLHRDAAGNDSAVASGAQFTTSATNTSPSFTGPNIADISGTEAVALTPVDVSSRFFDSESGLTFSAIGSWPAGVTVSSAGVISGTPTTAGTYASLQVRATDAGSLTADSNAFTITVAAPAVAGISVTEPLKNNTGTVLASQSGVRVAVLQAADLVSVFETSGLTTNASGILATISDAAIITGQQYHVAIKLADGGVGITAPITAS